MYITIYIWYIEGISNSNAVPRGLRRAIQLHPYDADNNNSIQVTGKLLFDDNKIKMARKPGKKQKQNPVRCTGEGKRWKGNMRKGTKKIRQEPPVVEFGGEVILVRLALHTAEARDAFWRKTQRSKARILTVVNSANSWNPTLRFASECNYLRPVWMNL